MSDKNVLVCSSVGYFADDVHAHCATCHAPIVHRPHVPPDASKLCIRCASAWMNASETEPIIHVTQETLLEVALYHAKTKGTQ